jgi:hypothetical protein
MPTVGAILLLAAGAGGLKEEFYQDFTGPKLPPRSVLELAPGEGEQKFARHEPGGGVRVLVSGQESKFPPFGVSLRFAVSGDFEITASYELRKLDKPATGYGVSVSLWVMTDTPSVEAATLARSHRWDGNVWVADKGWWDVAKKEYRHDQEAFPTACQAGKLRLARTGPVLRFLVAEGNNEDFRELRNIPFKEEDLSQVHLGVDTGGSNGPVEVVLKDLRVRAKELPLGVTKKQTFRAWALWLAAGIAGTGVVVASALFLWLSARARRAGRKPEKRAERLQPSEE